MVDINRAWVERLHAPRYIWSQIAALNPKQGILCREEKSQQQLLTWDVETGETHALMPPLDYQLNATLSPDGEFITYLVPHPTHADVYQYVRVPFGGGTPQPIAPTALMNASPHIEEASGRIGFTAVTGNGYIAQVWTPDGKKPLFSYESDVLAYGPSLSFDGKIAVVATMQSAEAETTHLEAYDIDTGAKISQLVLPDTPLEAVKFAPFMGDTRLLVQAREGLLSRPLVWDVVNGGIDRLEGLDKDQAYGVWDWVDEKRIVLYEDKPYPLYFYSIYDVVDQMIIYEEGTIDRPLFAYSMQGWLIFHHHSVEYSYSMTTDKTNRATAINIVPPKQHSVELASFILQEQYGRGWYWNNLTEDRTNTVPLNQRPKVIYLNLEKSSSFSAEVSAWISQLLICYNIDLTYHAFDASQLDAQIRLLLDMIKHSVERSYVSASSPLLTAHNMAAALALLALHHDSSPWAGGVVVRPVLDWAHLYESVAPPEKAMMRLWFGGSPTEKPDAWREASPLRQTKPLSVPVKLLYHPYDSLTPIQHIQTYAANNPMVELIDISRDMVGPAHEQQEKLITRMLEAGLPLLQKGT